jgi:hypothetical protein
MVEQFHGSHRTGKMTFQVGGKMFHIHTVRSHFRENLVVLRRQKMYTLAQWRPPFWDLCSSQKRTRYRTHSELHSAAPGPKPYLLLVHPARHHPSNIRRKGSDYLKWLMSKGVVFVR